MGSDSEINARRQVKSDASLEAESIEDFNTHNTVHSYTVPNGDSVTATDAPQNSSTAQPASSANYHADDDMDDKASGSFVERFLKFLIKSSPFARAARFILWGSLLGFIGAGLFAFDPQFSFLSVAYVPSHVNCFAFCLIGYGILLVMLHSIVIFAHKQPFLYQSNLLHWITEFEEFLASGTWVAFLLGIFANVTAPVAYNANNYDYFLKVYLLANEEPRTHVRLCCISLVVIVFSAVKRHFMHKLALQFNYSNYCDRVEESLFIERTLQALNKARSAYKFRKRWRTFLSDGRNGNSGAKRTGNATIQMSDFVDIRPASPSFNLKEFSENGAKAGARPSQSSPIASETSATSPTLIDIASPIKPPASGQNNPQPPAASASPSKDAKQQFEEFERLCNRTAAQFDSLSGADIRVEIHRESRRIAAQMFKWLCHPQRGDISATDLEPFIENPDELNRFMAILKKSQKVPAHLQTASFSEGDLRRAIHAALLERYGLAKSMETVEMALGKIDGILNFLLLVLVASLVERLFFSSSTASPLLSIATIFFSASFFFKDVAKSTFESIIFLLIIHPFDIGDRVYIKLDTGDSKVGGDCTDNLLVVEMNLMSTVFERWDGVKIYISNSVLATKPIYNIRRSGPIIELIHLSFAHSTRVDQLESLRSKFHGYLKVNRQDFTEFHRVNIDALENCNRMNVTIVFQHASNWQDFELQMARKTKILSFLKNSIEDLGINYLPPVQRIELITSGEVNRMLV